jgi:hypothetical protein
MKFYLGTHAAHWLTHLPIPLMVSRNRLAWRDRVIDAPRGGIAQMALAL